jgi:hypothetical protein
MPEEIIVGIIFGFWIGAPVGWFMKSAFTWRREARRLSPSEPNAVPAPAPALNARMESLMERLSQRLETVEDRLEFTERLIDARTPGRGPAGRRLAPAASEAESGETRG